MAFGLVSTLYFPDTSANSVGTFDWGTDIRKLITTALGSSANSTQMNVSTGGAVTRTFDPFSTSTADLDQTLYGWAIQVADMGSATGALRFFPAGNHTMTATMNQSTVLSVAGTVTMYVYKVGAAPGRTRTLIASNSAAVTWPATGSFVTATVTVACPAITFAVDETIQYSFELNAAGTIGGRIIAFFTGLSNSVQARIDTPELGIVASGVGASSASASTAGAAGIVLGTAGASSASSSAAGTFSARADMAGAATASSSAAAVGSSVAGTVGAAAGAATAAGAASRVLGTVGTAQVGGGGGTTTIKRTVLLFDD